MTDTEENLDETIERVKETLDELEKKKAAQAKDKLKDLGQEYQNALTIYQVAAQGVVDARNKYIKAAMGVSPKSFWFHKAF